MKIICEHCGEENDLQRIKKHIHSRGRVKNIEHCHSCGRKIFIPTVRRFSDEENGLVSN